MNDIVSIINEEINNFNQSEYLRWKRQNVTLRGMADRYSGTEGNGSITSFGTGLYTAFLSNKSLAKKYGNVYFVLGAIPKHPKVVNDWNLAEMFIQGLVMQYGKKIGIADYFDAKKHFELNSSIEKEMLKLGYDGFVIKGREMVNYTPDNDKIRYFETENQLIRYYEDFVN